MINPHLIGWTRHTETKAMAIIMTNSNGGIKSMYVVKKIVIVIMSMSLMVIKEFLLMKMVMVIFIVRIKILLYT